MWPVGYSDFFFHMISIYVVTYHYVLNVEFENVRLKRFVHNVYIGILCIVCVYKGVIIDFVSLWDWIKIVDIGC